ncbi:ATP-dependent DNA helicase RecQ [Podospora australis]|uniref:DNA 3'-5' helicase n=1 Tax=Podospora australis TaxID=1536484 RepID=A0AAN6WNP2_9PEZI|nr:ATP-dependent DNA helicase RecQ [Podospora australis]
MKTRNSSYSSGPPPPGGSASLSYQLAQDAAAPLTPPPTLPSPIKRKRGGEEQGNNDNNVTAEVEKQTRVHTKTSSSAVLKARQLAIINGILNEKFNHSHFRSYQEEVILRVLNGKNTLVVLPTGAGKSLCFQIPALAFEQLDEPTRAGKHGVTVVISPLLALIKDQVDALKKRGIPVGALDSTQTAEEYRATCQALKEGKLRLLYCVPEKLNTKGFVKRLRKSPGGVRLVAVDEAHCVSEWGHSFRPEYLKVARFVRHVEAERVICLTATATAAVTEDVCEVFRIEEEDVFRSMPSRDNLWLQIEHTLGSNNSIARALKFVQENDGPTIIYALFKRQVNQITAKLKEAGLKAEAFHSTIPLQTKRRVQEGFMAGTIRIIVCTIAFGLGIDKADVRNVIQIGLPRSIEEYTQQVGRAGRDDLPAKCVLYVSPDDYMTRKNLEHSHFPSRETITGIIRDIFHVRCRAVPAGGIMTVNQHQQVQKHGGIDGWKLDHVYAALELRFGLLHQLPREEVPGQLRNDSISYIEQYGSNARFRIRVAPLEVNVKEISDEIYSEMENKRNEKIWRAAQFMQMVSGKRCISQALAAHFDEEVDEEADCSSCSVCVKVPATPTASQTMGSGPFAPPVIHVPGLLPPSPVIQGFDEQEVLSCSQLVDHENRAVWGFSQVPIIEAESDSEDGGL